MFTVIFLINAGFLIGNLYLFELTNEKKFLAFSHISLFTVAMMTVQVLTVWI